MPDAADLVAAADTLEKASMYAEAITAYTRAIELVPTAPQYYIKRSTAYQRSGNVEAALKDAEQAVLLAQQRGKAELIASAQVRRGISLNGLKRYIDSNEAFDAAKNAGSKDKTMDIWISKNNHALKQLSEEEQTTSNVDIIPNTLPYPDEPEQNKRETTTVSASTDEVIANAEPHAAPIAPAAPTRVRHEWYQNDTSVFVDVFFKNIPKDKCSVEMEPQALSVTFPLTNGSDFTFQLDPLCHPIDPTISSYEILTTKLSLKLTKASRGTKWASLESTEPLQQQDNKQQSGSSIAYPTSSRTGAKNWDKLEKDAIKDAETWEKPEGDAAANALFRDLYKNASPDVRRAMEKSYVESSGTALSTNWEEVSRGRVETKPPDSMVAKKWD